MQDNQTLAGVVGIDIPVSKFEELAPIHQLSPLGYAFGLNQNGFLVFHPRLWMDSNFLEDPAHIDFADVEGDSDEFNDLRRAMIDHQSGVKNVTTSIKLQAGHVIPLHLHYYYRKLESSSFG